MDNKNYAPLPETCPMCGEPFQPVEFGWNLTRWEFIERSDGSFEYDAGEALGESKDCTIGCRSCGEDFDAALQKAVMERIT